MNNKDIEAFFALLRAGLWEAEPKLSVFDHIDLGFIRSLAQEQSVVGLIAAGLEHAGDSLLTTNDRSQLIGQILTLEKRNTAMNSFIAVLVDIMQKEGIYTLLVKGQGIAQCYERPLWRSCGDIDLFLSDEDYEKAKAVLIPLATSVEREFVREKHLGMTIHSWTVELHGGLYSGLSKKVEKGLDEVSEDIFYRGGVRTWLNGETQVPLLSADNDAIYVFTHILQHFFKGGIGLRQICDWCRLLWTYRNAIDLELLDRRLGAMGLKMEWEVFGTFAVDYLGMPASAMPFYIADKRLKRKAERVCSFVIAVGNFGHNRDMGRFGKYPYLIRKVISFEQRVRDLCRHARIFPMDAVLFLPRIILNGVNSAMRGE